MVMRRPHKALAAVLAGGAALSPVHAVSAHGKKPQAAHVSPASQPTRGAIAESIRNAAKRFGVDTHTLEALLWHESRFDPKVGRSSKGAVGIAQFTAGGRRGLERMRQTRGAPLKFTLADALNPFMAIPAAAEFLAGLRDYCGSLPRAIGAYATGKCSKGANYARRVLRLADWLRAQAEPRT
jgi:soluble lytic murein transglycosylase-like protein